MCRFAGAIGGGTTGAIAAAGGGTGGLAGGLDIMAPITEDTTPPVINAINSLMPLAALGCGGAPVSGTVFCASGLLVP